MKQLNSLWGFRHTSLLFVIRILAFRFRSQILLFSKMHTYDLQMWSTYHRSSKLALNLLSLDIVLMYKSYNSLYPEIFYLQSDYSEYFIFSSVKKYLEKHFTCLNIVQCIQMDKIKHESVSCILGEISKSSQPSIYFLRESQQV